MKEADKIAGTVWYVYKFSGKWRPVVGNGAGTLILYVPEMTPLLQTVASDRTTSCLSTDIQTWPLQRVLRLKLASGLSMEQLFILGRVITNGPVGPSEMCKLLGTSAAAALQQLRVLQQAGLLVRKPADLELTTDRRMRKYGIDQRTMVGIADDIGRFIEESGTKLTTLTKLR